MIEEDEMSTHDWITEINAAVTVTNAEGRIIEMNAQSVEIFAGDGGRALIGRNVLDCHPEPARSKLRSMMETGRTNVYTIQKNGKKKLVYQAPWSVNGRPAGFVEISFEVPWDMPHFNRDDSGMIAE